MAVGQVAFKSEKRVKKIHVSQRENPIVNRLNKTRVEKFPDLKAEKDEALRKLRKKDQASQRERVRVPSFLLGFRIHADECSISKKKRHALRRSGRSWRGSAIMRMMISTMRMRLRLRRIRCQVKMKTTSCSGSQCGNPSLDQYSRLFSPDALM